MIVNFRDIGGIRVPSGRLKKGFFFRSGVLADITEADESFLKNECHIKKIYDFRSEAEIKEQPDKQIPGIEIENIDILASQKNNMASLTGMLNATGMKELMSKNPNIGSNIDGVSLKNIDVNKLMLETYTAIAISDSALAGYSKFLTEVLAQKEPILFHCFSGKDRTGFAAALLLKLAGASEDQILADYLESNVERKAANEKLISSLEGKLSPDQMKMLSVSLNVDKSYLIHSKDEILKKFGSFESYLADGLKLPKDYVEKFRETFVTEG